ncbi:MAG: hypothetical protein JOZ97_06925 [Candidatus Eremiobacteraeota bacterium]|nr:hypothetical protein [Candidatus Eremiobacteraeota bacterium]
MFPRITVVSALALLCSALPVLADSNTGVVNGYVYRANTHQAVCGIRVTAEADNQVAQQTYTDEHGFFTFISRFPGIVHVYADDSNPGADRLVDVHPMMLSQPVLYVGSRATQAGLARCARKLRAERDR